MSERPWKPIAWFASAFASIALLGGCATPTQRAQAQLKREYRQKLSLVTAGMTRRELYKIFPPSSPPKAEPARLECFISMAIFIPHREAHPLQGGFSLLIQYRLANLAEYPIPPYAPGGGTKDNPERSGYILEEPRFASRENPSDEILCVPQLRGPGIRREPIYTFSVGGRDLQVSKHARRDLR